MEDLGKSLFLFGVVLAIIGGIIFAVSKVPGVGQLPGEITIQRDGFACFVPLASSIVLSIVLTIVLNLILRIFNK